MLIISICSADDAPFRGRVDVSLSAGDALTFRRKMDVSLSAGDASSFGGRVDVLLSAADDPFRGSVQIYPPLVTLRSEGVWTCHSPLLTVWVLGTYCYEPRPTLHGFPPMRR